VQAAVPAALLADEGTASITVVNPGATAPLVFTTLDNDALTATGYDLSGNEGQQVNGIVATFTDVTNPINLPGDFTANINWGDGSSSDGTITAQGNLFVVRGSHTYAEKGSYSISVRIKDDDSGVASASASSTATISDAPLNATGIPVTATEGQVFPNEFRIAAVARFTDANPNASEADFTASIDWGNGVTTMGFVAHASDGSFIVDGPPDLPVSQITVIYPEEGNFTITTTIKDKDGSQAIVTSAASVADASLTATANPIHAVEGVIFSAQIGSFTDANPGATLGDFGIVAQPGLPSISASLIFPGAFINWGDGTTSYGSLIQQGGFGATFLISASHTYVKTGSYSVSITITDEGGSSTTNTTTATVTDPNEIVGRIGETGQIWTGISTGSSFTSSMWAAFNPNVTWVDFVTGDFTGDGRTDIAARDLNTGNWWVGVSNGSSFTTTLWTTWSPNVTWVDVQVGDFLGNGMTDIVGRMQETGQWWVAQSTGSSFSNSLWGTWSPMATWVDVKVGDFNGDGKADITGRFLEGGAWWTGVSTGSSFTTSLWATWNPNVTWVDVNVGDFNDDGKADITGRVWENCMWWTAISTGSSFNTTMWTTWNPNMTWVDVKVGDFNGDGMADIVGRVLQTGQWFVGISNGSAFTNSLWATWNPNVTWVDVQVGDFNGDGKAEITGRDLNTGNWWTGISNGSAFATSMWATWSNMVTWVDVRSGDFA
jgi:hypothetical protein